MNAPHHTVKFSMRVLPVVVFLALCAGYPGAAMAARGQASEVRAGGASSIGWVDNRLESVRTARAGKSTVVKFIFKEPLTEVPDGVATTNPATLSFDFDGMRNSTGFLTKGFKVGEIQALDLVKNKGAVRAVFKLRKPMSYTADIERGILVVRFAPLPKAAFASARASDAPQPKRQDQVAEAKSKPARSEVTGLFERPQNAASASSAADLPKHPPMASAAVGGKLPEVSGSVVAQKPVVANSVAVSDTPIASAVPASVIPKAAAKVDAKLLHSVRAIDFRKSPNGSAKVLIDLSDESAPVEIKQTPTSVVISFDKTTFAPGLAKRVVTAKGTPVQAISGSTSGDNAKVVIETIGKWKINSYQSGKRLTVDVLPESASGAVGEEKYRGDKISLDFQNVDVRAALKVIGDFTKLNVVASDTVQGSVMLRMFDVPWDQALDIILQMRGLDMRRNGSVIWVAPRDEIAKREKELLETKQQMSDVEQLQTEYFALSYAKADEVAALLTSDKQRILSKRGSANSDKRTNQVIVHDIPSAVEEARKVISKIDIYMRQVQIEARIVEASDTFGRSLGARLGVNNLQASGVLGGNLAVGGGLNTTAWRTGQIATGNGSGSGAGGGNLPDSLSVNLPSVPSSSGANPGVLSMVLFNNAATKFLNMELSALEADGRGKIVSSPRVVTADRETALIEQGTELPYQEASSSGATSVAFRKANLSLKVEPHITPDGNIIMEVEINKDAPGAQTAGGIAINTKHVKTTVMIENGGTVVIGGIYTQDERSDVNKIPFLGDVPVAGALFRNKTRTQSKTELLIFLTPTVLDTRGSND